MVVSQIRLRNLLLLLSKSSATELHEKTGVALAQFSQMKRRLESPSSPTSRGMGDKVARKIERGLGLPEGWMDAPHESVDRVTEGSSVESVAQGLTPIQQAFFDTAIRLMRGGLLSDPECLAVLHGWQGKIEQLQALAGD
jgi:hypothetical protein